MTNSLRVIVFLMGAVVLSWLYNRWAYRDKDDKGPELTGRATVVSKGVAQGRYLGKSTTRWNYLMTFSLADGEEIELYVTDDIFSSLKEGQTGLLNWQGKRFYSFEPEE